LKVRATRLDKSGQLVGAAVEVGDTISVGAGEGLALDVDVQGPEWMQFNRLELYSHTSGREAVNGESNSSWPAGRVLELKAVDAASLPIEPVPGPGALRRVHLTSRFIAKPTRDTWYVVMVRGLGGRTMFPLHDDQPIAYTNAILVDGDGRGKYDDFPLKPGQPLRMAAPAKPKARPLSVDDAKKVLRALLVHDHH
jgi:hypothetical protein